MSPASPKIFLPGPQTLLAGFRPFQLAVKPRWLTLGFLVLIREKCLISHMLGEGTTYYLPCYDAFHWLALFKRQLPSEAFFFHCWPKSIASSICFPVFSLLVLLMGITQPFFSMIALLFGNFPVFFCQLIFFCDKGFCTWKFTKNQTSVEKRVWFRDEWHEGTYETKEKQKGIQ